MTSETHPRRDGTEASDPAAPTVAAKRVPEPQPATDFMILPDGTIYARNLTPDLAGILAELAPQDTAMALRASKLRNDP